MDNIRDCQAKLAELHVMRHQLKQQIYQQAQTLQRLKLQRGKIGIQVSNSLWMEMRQLNQQNYQLASSISTDPKYSKVNGGMYLRSRQGCKQETIRMLTIKLNELRTILDKMQNNPMDPILSAPILLQPTNRSVEVNHLITQNQQLLAKSNQLDFQQKALQDSIKRMKALLFQKIQKKKQQVGPMIGQHTLDRDYYCLKNLAPKPQPVNKIEQILKNQQDLSEKPSEQIVRLAGQGPLFGDMITPLTIPIPTPFGKAHSIGQILYNTGAVNMVQYSLPQKQSKWQNFKSLFLSYFPGQNSSSSNPN